MSDPKLIIRTAWQPKAGHRPEEYEDAFAVSSPRLPFRAAIADGATESIFSGGWARALVDAFVSGCKTNEDAGALNAGDMASNSADMAPNAGDMAPNVGDMATNSADMASNSADMASNAGDMASNSADMAPNAGDMAPNVGDKATNSADMASNARDLAPNADGATPNTYSPMSEAIRQARDSWSPEPDTRWYVAAKAAEGAHAAILSFELRQDGWVAEAVGDCCLFHLRGDALLKAWPIDDPDAFTHRPPLVSSRDTPTEILGASGDWCPGDAFVFATDAVAEWLLRGRSIEALNGEPVERWLEAVKRGGMRNDDATLIHVYIQP